MEAVDLRMKQETEVMPLKREPPDEFASEQATIPQEPEYVEVKQEPYMDDEEDVYSAARQVEYSQRLELGNAKVKEELYDEEWIEEEEAEEEEEDDEADGVELEEEKMTDKPQYIEEMVQVVVKEEDDGFATWKKSQNSQSLHDGQENITALPEKSGECKSVYILPHSEIKNSPQHLSSLEEDKSFTTPSCSDSTILCERNEEKKVCPDINTVQLKCENSVAVPVAENNDGSSLPQQKKRTKNNNRKNGQHCCEFCGKIFSQSGNLTRHRRIHTGEQPYQCEICGKAFSKSDLLTTHRRIHTGEQPFTCKTCAKTFTQAGHLRRHMLKHTGQLPYSCDVCGKAFARSDWMKNHRRMHTGEQPCTF